MERFDNSSGGEAELPDGLVYQLERIATQLERMNDNFEHESELRFFLNELNVPMSTRYVLGQKWRSQHPFWGNIMHDERQDEAE